MALRLWLLRLTPIPAYDWDCAFGFVVRAETEADARALATKERGDEDEQTWLDTDKSSCVPLEADGECGVILRDFNAS